MGWDVRHMNCYEMVWNGTEKYVPWTNLDIYTPSQWYMAVRLTKLTQPKYEIIEMNTCNVLGFKEVAEEIFTNRKSADD